MAETERGKFFCKHLADIRRAADKIEQQLVARHFNVQSSTCLLIAMEACAAFAGIPETPARVQLQNLREAMTDDPVGAGG